MSFTPETMVEIIHFLNKLGMGGSPLYYEQVKSVHFVASEDNESGRELVEVKFSCVTLRKVQGGWVKLDNGEVTEVFPFVQKSI